MEQPQSKIESEWRTETEKHKDGIMQFLKRHLTRSLDEKASIGYDPATELHISGDNSPVLEKIRQGEAMINVVRILYENGQPRRIHVAFNSEGKGHAIDVYIGGRALTDYLQSES